MYKSTEQETDLHLREQDELRHCRQQAKTFRSDLQQDDELEGALTHRRKFGEVIRVIEMVTTESLNSASSRGGVYVFSVAHERDGRARAQGTHDVTTPTTHDEGWRFAAESPWTLWHTGGSRQGHPRNTGAREGRPWVALRKPTTKTTTDKRQQDTDQSQDKRAFR